MNQAGFIEKVATKITTLGLATPAILLLEAHKPLAFLGSQLLLVAQPILAMFIPPPLIDQTVDLLTDPAQLDQLIASLETESRYPSTPHTPQPASPQETP